MYSILVLAIFTLYASIAIKNFISFQRKLGHENSISLDEEDSKRKKRALQKDYIKKHFLLILITALLFLGLIFFKLNSHE